MYCKLYSVEYKRTVMCVQKSTFITLSCQLCLFLREVWPVPDVVTGKYALEFTTHQFTAQKRTLLFSTKVYHSKLPFTALHSHALS